jgi:hypothetical protein
MAMLLGLDLHFQGVLGRVVLPEVLMGIESHEIWMASEMMN